MKLTAAQQLNFLPLTAWGYAWWRARSLTLLTGQPFSLAREERLFLSLGQPIQGEHWLDIGTSTGFYAGVLARQGCRVDALELSSAMLREASRREPSALISWHRLNAEDTRWPAEMFNGISIGATLNETARPDRMLREAARLLKPGGRLWLMFSAQQHSPGQRVLQATLGLTFPDPAWIERVVPELSLRHAVRFGAIEFMLLVKPLTSGAAIQCLELTSIHGEQTKKNSWSGAVVG